MQTDPGGPDDGTDPVAVLVADIRAELAAAADPQRAEPMRRYMKSALPFHGVPARTVERLVRAALGRHPVPDRGTWVAVVRALYDGAAFREERYAALQVAGHRLHRPYRDARALPLWRHLVVTGTRWDLVDWTASFVDEALRQHRAQVSPTVWAWAQEDDLWLRRVAIIAQLKARADTDLDLLTHAVLANTLGSRFGDEFFIRKAIGWALRQYARTDPGWVSAFVAEHDEQLSGLSRREALKHLG